MTKIPFSERRKSEDIIAIFSVPERSARCLLFQPSDNPLNTHASDCFKKPWFWEQLTPVEHLLLFQNDSILCANSDQKVYHFLQYELTGVSVDEERGLGMGYNGGLSLRNRSDF